MRSATTSLEEYVTKQKIHLRKRQKEELRMFYIGVDLGTSAVKLLLMDSEGKIRKIVSNQYPISFPHPGWSEQNPVDWYEKSIEGIRELTEDINRQEVAGISFGGQMHGLVTLDGQDEVIRPAILWNDGRSTKETDYLNEVIGKERLSEYCVYRIHGSEDFMDEGERAGSVRKNPKNYAAKRLFGLPPVWGVLQRLFRCIRNVAS